MAEYQFRDEIPIPIAPICEDYEPGCQTFADIREDCDSELAYCASCGCQTQDPVVVGGSEGEDDGTSEDDGESEDDFKGTRLDEVDFCERCGDASSPEFTLRKKALRLRNVYGDQLASEQQRSHLLRWDRSYSDRKYTEAVIMHQQCKAALYRMEEAVGKAFPIAADDNDSPVNEILEMEFWTTPWYNYAHCAYIIKTKIGKFVFDPTGVQFGPGWPVFVLYQDYKHRILQDESAIISVEPLGSAKKEYIEKMVELAS